MKPNTLQWSSQVESALIPHGFVEVVHPAAPANGVIEVILADDLRIRVSGQFDPAVLRRVVAALGGR